jgi:hypothetical protein
MFISNKEREQLLAKVEAQAQQITSILAQIDTDRIHIVNLQKHIERLSGLTK